ncbi:hypothetical protein C7G42_22810 [Bradyrhizobium sp. MOS003]|nr:hypothetical protein C7G42_22810 [Bradyrhizobium sp. MOS003]
MRGALATKQSRLPPQNDSGLLRFAHNDGVRGTAARFIDSPRSRMTERYPGQCICGDRCPGCR